jgi:hypothetical protein
MSVRVKRRQVAQFEYAGDLRKICFLRNKLPGVGGIQQDKVAWEPHVAAMHLEGHGEIKLATLRAGTLV